MKKLITHNFIIETKVRPVDFNIADEILGRASEEISGKLTAPSQSKDISSQVLLHDINININKCIKLYVVTMYICGCLFLYTKSKDINYIKIRWRFINYKIYFMYLLGPGYLRYIQILIPAILIRSYAVTSTYEIIT